MFIYFKGAGRILTDTIFKLNNLGTGTFSSKNGKNEYEQ